MSTAAPRRRLSADDRRAEITSAARGLFAANGYQATTTRQLAEAAGVSDALLYRHFANKHELLESVVSSAIDTFSSLPPLDRLAALPDDELLRRLGQGFLSRVSENLDLITLLVGEHSSVRDLRFAEFIDGAATHLGQDLARRGMTTDARSGYLAARSFFGSLISYALLQKVLGMDEVRAVDADSYLEHLVQTTTR